MGDSSFYDLLKQEIDRSHKVVGMILGYGKKGQSVNAELVKEKGVDETCHGQNRRSETSSTISKR